MKKLLLISIIASIFLINLVSAVTINSGTIINSTGLNLTINFTSTMYADTIVVDATYIELTGFRSSSASNEKIDFNITEENMSYFGSDLPYYSTSSTDSKIITSNLNNASVNSTVHMDLQSCNGVVINYGSAFDTYSQTYQPSDYSCSNNIAAINLDGLEDGANTFTIEIGCDRLTMVGYRLVILIAAVLLIMVISFYVYKKYESGGLSIGDLVTLFIAIIVSVILYVASGQNLGGHCGPVG